MPDGLNEYWELDLWDDNESSWKTEAEMPSKESADKAIEEYADTHSAARIVHVTREVVTKWVRVRMK